MTNFILLAMVLFGSAHTAYGQLLSDGNTPEELIRNILLVSIGVIGLVFNNAGSFLAMLGSTFQANRPLPQPQPYFPQPVYPQTQPQPDVHKDMSDFEALFKLRDKFKSLQSNDGVDLVAKLVDKLFRGEQK